jgi:ABC-type transport system substrate-binding protein
MCAPSHPTRDIRTALPLILARRWAVILLVVPIGCREAEAPVPSRLVVAYPAGPETLLPHLAHDEYSMAILSNVYEPLVELDGDLALRPALAEAWYTPDESSWVFRLRAGARLHDGRTLEARAVAISLERARSDPRSRVQAELTAVSAIEAPDLRTVVVRTRFPRCQWPVRFPRRRPVLLPTGGH